MIFSFCWFTILHTGTLFWVTDCGTISAFPLVTMDVNRNNDLFMFKEMRIIPSTGLSLVLPYLMQKKSYHIQRHQLVKSGFSNHDQNSKPGKRTRLNNNDSSRNSLNVRSCQKKFSLIATEPCKCSILQKLVGATSPK